MEMCQKIDTSPFYMLIDFFNLFSNPFIPKAHISIFVENDFQMLDVSYCAF